MTKRTGIWLALPLLTVSACAMSPAAFDGDTPPMRPETFFDGTTHSTGVLESLSGAPTDRFHVEGLSRHLPNGDLQLDQTITFEHDAPETRTWVMHRVDDHRYTASLSDAVGPVAGEAYGNIFHLTYPMRHPVLGTMEQWLYLQPDAKTVVNEATVTILGIPVAHLSERITHDDR